MNKLLSERRQLYLEKCTRGTALTCIVEERREGRVEHIKDMMVSHNKNVASRAALTCTRPTRGAAPRGAVTKRETRE